MTPRPADLPPDQAPIWDRLTQLAPNADSALLRAAVAAQREWDQLNQVCQSSGPVVQGPQGVRPNPAYVQRRAAAQLLLRYHHDLGLAAMRPSSDRPGDASLPCVTCGAVHDPRRCQGHARARHEGQCKQAKGERTDHVGWGNCAWHGGSTASGIKAADRERAEATFYQVEGVAPVGNPLERMAELAGLRWAWMERWASEANRLEAQVGHTSMGEERVRAAAGFLRQHANDVHTLLESLAKSNIDERLVAVQAQASELLVQRMSAILDGFEQRLRQLLEARLAPGESWPSDEELDALMDSSFADSTGP